MESAKDKIFTLNKYCALHTFAQKNFANKRIYEINLKDKLSNKMDKTNAVGQNTSFLYLEGVWKRQVNL